MAVAVLLRSSRCDASKSGGVLAALGPEESVVIQDRADAAILGEQRIIAVAEQVQVERLVGLLLAVAVDGDGDRLRRLTGVEGQRRGLGDIVAGVGRSPSDLCSALRVNEVQVRGELAGA